ncbi:MAG TPA: serine/threonine-protein kinase, partial [Planctomycetota bacterium]|nr:serine/threonine-protein kinase [Planctomycetota bacterium]
MEPEVQGEFDADFECARRAVELGWLTREQVEAAVLKAEGSPGLRLRSHLPFTPDQIRQLGLPPPPVPSELDPAADDPARRVAHYVLADQRWTGGMGHVVKAWDTRLSRWVALKFMKNLGGTRLRACFEQEARLAAGLIHPGIAAIHEIGEHEGAPFISMQFIEGRTFGEIRPRLKPREAARLIRDAARAVAFAHAQGIIHRDLKPSNLMIDATDRVYVMDFGLARRAEVSGPHRGPGRSMTISGTPEYISPEQARAGQTDERTDVHGLGATLYDLLTGRPPNRGKTPEEVLRSLRVADRLSPRRLNRNVDADLETIVLKCLAQDPAHRYPSATDLADDLERYLNRDAIAARRPSVTYRLRVRLAKRKVAVTAVVASLGLIGVLSWWFLVGSPAMEHTRLYADAMNLWAGVEKSTGAGGAPREIARKARKAREGFERALQVRGSSRAHLMKGRCLELEGHHNGALTEFERALDLEPGFTEAKLQLAKVLMEKYQRSRGLPQTVIGLSKKGSLYFEQMPEETAEQVGIRERVKRLLQDSRPEPAHESLLRGLLAMGRGNHPEAAMAFAVYTEAERWDAQTMILQGICLYYSNDFEGAAGAMSRSLGRVETPSAFRWRGDVMRMRELHDDAISDYTKAIDMDPKFEKAYVGRGSARRDKGQLEDSIKDCDVAIALHPECTAAYFNRGNAKHDQGRYGEAIEDYSQAIELHPRHAEAYINRGNSKSRLGRREEALADYSKAIEMDSRQIKAYVNRGLQKVTFGLYNDAIADFDKALGLNPEHANAHNGRGMALHGNGQFSDALAALT